MIDWFLGLLTPAQWDAWRNWLATFGGLAALAIATSTYRRSVRHKREEQARLVYSRLKAVEYHEGDSMFAMREAVDEANYEPGVIPWPDGKMVKPIWLTLPPAVQFEVVVHNGSKELIGPVEIRVFDPEGAGREFEYSHRIETVDPESNTTVEFAWPNDFAPNTPSLASEIRFRDSSGQWWCRRRADSITSIRSRNVRRLTKETDS